MRYGALIRGPVSCRSPRSTLVTTSTSRPPPPFASLIPHSCMARRITSARGTGSPVWAYSSCTMSLRAWRRLARSCWPPTSFASRACGGFRGGDGFGYPTLSLAVLVVAALASRRAPGKLDNDVCARMGLDEMGLPCQRFLRHDRQRGLGLLEAGHLLLALGFEGGNLSEYVKRYRATLPIVRNRDLLLVAHPFGLLGLLGAGLPRRGLFEET